MVIQPLPVFEADADPHHRSVMTDEEIYARLEPPKTIVVRFGAMKMIGEYAYDGEAKPGCGTKLVVRTHRGTELANMLTTTCENAGCSKSVTRKEMLEFIENSGGKDYPFHTEGKVLRIATIEDLNKQSQLNTDKGDLIRTCKKLIGKHNLEMKLVDVESILGGELLTFFYMAEERVDFRALVRELAANFKTRIELRQVGARDEARLVADYERCGQHCCCKNFLKVLRPVSMRLAKMQKATLDPLKISGRCGRLMCCLRYEDQTYKDLKKNLPHRKTRVGTMEGPGIVIDSKILTQLVLVKLDHNDENIAVPVEELMDPNNCPAPGESQKNREQAVADTAAVEDPLRGLSVRQVEERTGEEKRSKRRRGGRKHRSKQQQQDAFRETVQKEEKESRDDGTPKKKRRRRRRHGTSGEQAAPSGDQKPKLRRRRRRRKGQNPGDGSSRPPGGESSGSEKDG